MRVVGERAVGMANQNVVRAILVLAIWTAFVGIIFDFHDDTVARGVDGCADRHLPIDGVLLRASMAVRAVVTLRNSESGARGVGQRIDRRVVVLRRAAADR